MDISPFIEVAQQLPVACKPVIKYVTHTVTQHTGFYFHTLAIASLVSAAVAAGMAWYVRGRGIQGVKNDMANAQNEVIALKAKISDQVATKTA